MSDEKDTPAGKEPQAEVRRLWTLYRTLSQELLKFIEKQDVDEFLALAAQRGKVVDGLKALPREVVEAYRVTPECQAIQQEIRPLDMQIVYKAKSWLNKSRRQNAMVRSYDLTTEHLNPLGNILNREF